jgi:DNA-binding SARP family transcriptional activator
LGEGRRVGAGSLRFGVLGPFECADERGPVRVDQAKPRALLAMLVVRAGSVVAGERLIEDLWEQDPPRSAVNTLQTYVHKLRGLLPPGALVTRDGGYELALDGAWVDAAQFEQLAASAAASAPSPRRRAQVLREALGLWRGEALADFADAAWAQPESARLGELRLDALERCIEAELDARQEGAVLAELHELVRAYPFRERFSGLLMLALYRQGRQADALRAYERLRRTLSEELGIGPSDQLVELERAILLQDPRLDPPSRTDELSVPLSARVVAASSGTFVGRPFERKVLEDAFKDVVAGERATVLIGGEPGIGKTSLAASFARAAAEDGALVLYGHSDADLGIPFQPWSEALGHLIAHASHDLIDAHTAVHGMSMAPLVPELVERAVMEVDASADLDSQRQRLFRAVADLLGRVGSASPVVLLLDDLHWADRSTVELLRFFVALDRPLRVLLLATFRDSEINPDNTLSDTLASFTRQTGVRRIRLGGLNDDELLMLVELAADEPPRRRVALRDALMHETDGNPFFAVEILRHLADMGAIAHDAADSWNTAGVDDRGLPVGVREVIRSRIGRLGKDCAAVLSVAAVVGNGFDLDVVGPIVATDVETLTDLCEHAVAAAILDHTDVPGRYLFTHALIEHSIYDDLPPTRRALAHLGVAQQLERLHADDLPAYAGQLAHHWTAAATAHGRHKVLIYAEMAGDQAMLLLAPVEAAQRYIQALELLEEIAATDDATRARLLVGLGTAQRHSGDAAHRQTLLDAAAIADRIGDAEVLVRAALANTRGWNSVYGGVDEERVAVLRGALARLADSRSLERARLLTILCLESYYAVPLSDRLALAQEAVDIARESDDQSWIVADILARNHEAISMPHTLELRIRWTTEAVERLATLRHTRTPLHSGPYVYRCLCALEDADGDTLRAAAATARQLIVENPLPFFVYNNTFHAAWIAALDGDIDRAEQLAEEALTLGMAAGQADAFTVYGGQLICLRWLQGRLPELVDAVAQSRADNPGLDIYRAVDCWVKATAGRHGEVTAELDRETSDDFPGFEDQHWLTALTLWAEAAAIIRHRDAAVLLRARLEPWHRQCTTTHISFGGVVAQYLAMLDRSLGDLDAADAWYAEALELHQRLASPVLVAWTQAAWAGLLLERNDTGDAPAAHSMLEDAQSAAEGHGWRLVENAITEALQTR